MTFETACLVVANQNAQMEVSVPPGGRGCKKLQKVAKQDTFMWLFTCDCLFTIS